MKRQWENEELIEHWTLQVEERAFLGSKTKTTRLGFAVLLKYFQQMGHFPQQGKTFPGIVIVHLATQVGVDLADCLQYDWHARTIREHRTQICVAFKLREATVADGEDMSRWLVKHVLPSNHQQDTIRASCYQHFRTLHLLQICLVYINTPMIQQVLNQPEWANKLAVADYQGLSPILYQHINPYGTFRLDMKEHIILTRVLRNHHE